MLNQVDNIFKYNELDEWTQEMTRTGGDPFTLQLRVRGVWRNARVGDVVERPGGTRWEITEIRHNRIILSRVLTKC